MKVRIFDHMNQCTPQGVAQLLPRVNNQRREQALRYKHTFGQFCCLQSWLMLQDLLERAPSEWTYNAHGKPQLTGEQATIHFSISHCREAIAVVIDNAPIGIDIESIRHPNNDLLQRVMTSEQRNAIQQAAQPDRAFTALWTQKEAVVKMQGLGIEGLDHLQSLPLHDAHIQTIQTERYIYSIAQNVKNSK